MYGGTITGVSACPRQRRWLGRRLRHDHGHLQRAVDRDESLKVQLLFGGHLAASVGPRGWGNNVGSSFINGGPYHIKLTQVDSLDRQS